MSGSRGGPPPLADGTVVEGPPAFVRSGPSFFHCVADVRQLADEIVELRLYLTSELHPAAGEVQPAPNPAGHRTQHRRQQYTRSFIHVGLLGKSRAPRALTPPLSGDLSRDVPWNGRVGFGNVEINRPPHGGRQTWRRPGFRASSFCCTASDGTGRESARPPACSSWCAGASAESPSSRSPRASGQAESRTPPSSCSRCGGTPADRSA